MGNSSRYRRASNPGFLTAILCGKLINILNANIRVQNNKGSFCKVGETSMYVGTM